MAHVRHSITLAEVGAALAALDLTEDGLDPLQRRALDLLAAPGRPIGARRLARQLGLSVRAFHELVEPELLLRRRIEVTPRGIVIARA